MVGAPGYEVDRGLLVVVPGSCYAFHEAHAFDPDALPKGPEGKHDEGPDAVERLQLLDLIDAAEALFFAEDAGIITNIASQRAPVIKAEDTHAGSLALQDGRADEAMKRAQTLLGGVPPALERLLRNERDARTKLAYPIALEHAFGVSGVSFDALLLPGSRPGSFCTIANATLRESKRAAEVAQHFVTHGKLIGATANGMDLLLLARSPKQSSGLASSAVMQALPASYVELDDDMPYLKGRKVAQPACDVDASCGIPLEERLTDIGVRFVADAKGNVVRDGTLLTVPDVGKRGLLARALVEALVDLDDDE